MIAVCVCVRFAIAGHMTNIRFHCYLISVGSNLFGIPQRGCPSDPRFLSALLALIRHQMPPVLKPPAASPDACVSHGGPQKRPARNDEVDGYVGARQPVLKRPAASLDACTSHGRLQKRPAGNDKVDRYTGVHRLSKALEGSPVVCGGIQRCRERAISVPLRWHCPGQIREAPQAAGARQADRRGAGDARRTGSRCGWG